MVAGAPVAEGVVPNLIGLCWLHVRFAKPLADGPASLVMDFSVSESEEKSRFGFPSISISILSKMLRPGGGTLEVCAPSLVISVAFCFLTCDCSSDSIVSPSDSSMFLRLLAVGKPNTGTLEAAPLVTGPLAFIRLLRRPVSPSISASTVFLFLPAAEYILDLTCS